MKPHRAGRGLSPESGGTVIVVVILVACLLVGLAAGFAARALTGERRPEGKTTLPGTGLHAEGAAVPRAGAPRGWWPPGGVAFPGRGRTGRA